MTTYHMTLQLELTFVNELLATRFLEVEYDRVLPWPLPNALDLGKDEVVFVPIRAIYAPDDERQQYGRFYVRVRADDFGEVTSHQQRFASEKAARDWAAQNGWKVKEQQDDA